MSDTVLILGDTGAGKSRAIKGLDPKETVVISCAGNKSLPWKGHQSQYTFRREENGRATGNMWKGVDVNYVLKVLDKLDKEPDLAYVKNIVIDDWQYLMADDFMKNAADKIGERSNQFWDNINRIGREAYILLKKLSVLREDLTIFVLAHIERGLDAMGNSRIKVKTIGNMLDNRITVEGLFTIVLLTHQKIIDTKLQYGFITKGDGVSTAKSPEEMFEDFIPNDLQYVKQKIHEYNTGVENADTTK